MQKTSYSLIAWGKTEAILVLKTKKKNMRRDIVILCVLTTKHDVLYVVIFMCIVYPAWCAICSYFVCIDYQAWCAICSYFVSIVYQRPELRYFCACSKWAWSPWGSVENDELWDCMSILINFPYEIRHILVELLELKLFWL